MSGILISKMPSNEYAKSSLYVVSCFCNHNSRSVTLKSNNEPPRRALAGIPIISQICTSRNTLLPSSSPSFEKNSTEAGVISS